jgi:hypothetical protein
MSYFKDDGEFRIYLVLLSLCSCHSLLCCRTPCYVAVTAVLLQVKVGAGTLHWSVDIKSEQGQACSLIDYMAKHKSL